MAGDNWKTATLGELGEITHSNVDKHIVDGELRVRLCNYLDVYRNRRITAAMTLSPGSATPQEVARFQLRKGDVLITKDSETPDDIGVPAVVVDHLPDTICGYHLAMIRPNDRIDSSFLGWYLQTDAAKRHFLRTANGITRFGLGLRAIGTLPVAHPPLPEQHAIAAVLDAADTAIERTRAAVEAARRVKRGLVQRFFEAGLGRVSCADSLNANPAKGWQLVLAGKLFLGEPKNGISPTTESAPPGFITFSIAAVRDGRVDLLNRDHWKYARIPAEVAEPYRLHRGDLLIVRGNANPDLVGKCGIVEEMPADCIYPDILKRVHFNTGPDGVDARFAEIAWNHAVVHNQVLKRAKTSNGTLKVNSRDVKQIVMPVPPRAEQERLVSVVQAAEELERSLVATLTAHERLKRGLMQVLLTGRVRVPVPMG